MKHRTFTLLFRLLALCAFVLTVGICTTHADLEPTGFAKPVADLRDYNGTFTGSPGTGTIGYSTLHRDNYRVGVNCEGEGCGSHPGVDIPVDSNTSVYAAMSGTVVISRCNWNGSRDFGTAVGWGGNIVIKSPNPYVPGRFVYLVYGHLNDWNDHPVGSTVQVGDLIGKSGGSPSSGTCPGNSSAAHLHFQIDNDNGHTLPWFPSMINRSVNTADSDFQVMANTYNPIPFLTGGYRWTFWEPHNREYWNLFNFQTWDVSDGALWFDGNADPFIQRSGTVPCGRSHPCSSAIAAESSIYNRVHLNMFNHCWNNPLQIYFTTSTDPNWNEDKRVDYWIPNWGAADFHVDMTQNSRWAGVITGIRIDPAMNCTPGAFDPNYFGNITIERSGIVQTSIILEPTFTSSATISPSSPQAGQATTITAKVTGTGGESSNNIVDVEVYNSNGTRVLQTFFEHQSLSRNAPTTYPVAWTPPTNGTYAIKVAIFSSDWTSTYHWNDNALSVSVGSSPPPPSEGQIDIWWPTDGSTVSGTTPFKGLLQNYSLSQYTMYWQVDGGGLVLMYDSSVDYPHKEAMVDVSGWTWRGTGPYTVNFVAKDGSGNTLAQRLVNIYVGQ